MPAVFAGGQVHKGGFRADNLKLSFGGTDVSGYLVQNVQFQYAQQVTMLYEIGSPNVYFVGGRANGSATLGRIIGPTRLAAKFITNFNDLCKPQDMQFDASAGCPAPGASTGVGSSYTLQDAVLTTVSVSVTSQDTVINEQLQFMFINMEMPAA